MKAASKQHSTPQKESEKKIKLSAIHHALNSDPVNIAALRKHAISKGGLLNDEVRRKVWPKLLNINVHDHQKKSAGDITKHRDYSQVVLDVNRSFKRFPKGMKDDQREVLQEQLTNIIVQVLIRHKQLHYYQGYHDICVTFLLAVGKDMALSIMDVLSIHHFRDFMDSTMDRTKHMLNYLFPIIRKANPVLHDFMQKSEVGTVFALAWLITWYGHVLNDYKSIVRLYDFFLACHPLMPVYLAAAIVLYREKGVLQQDCEMVYVHSYLSKIPQDLPFEHLIIKAGDLFVQYPPSAMAKEAKLHYKQSTAISKHGDFESAVQHQRPDAILQLMRERSRRNSYPSLRSQSSQVVKVAVWALSTAVGVAALAVLNTAAEFWV
ncbi:TBC1 domain family member 20-like [Antedon mediterranea]|uniref:TBC1 domain family member 20-like n=1 Tax=Antedon mediterranea TaxID=105859 RepID=UPI003AF5C9A2